MTGGISLRRFYARRALRLYPALIVVVLATGPIAMYDGIGRPLADSAAALSYVTDLWANYSYHVSLVVHSWSLSVEEQFYVAWPILLIVALAREWRLSRVLLIMVGASVICTVLLDIGEPVHLAVPAYLPTAHIAELASGIWLAVAHQRGTVKSLATISGTRMTLIALAALLAAEVFLPSGSWVLPLAVLACWPPVAHLVLHRESHLSRAFNARVLVWMGERSYGIYLWHYPVLQIMVRQGGIHPSVAAAAGLGVTLAVAALSWRYVEVPFLRAKRRFAEAPVAPAFTAS